MRSSSATISARPVFGASVSLSRTDCFTDLRRAIVRTSSLNMLKRSSSGQSAGAPPLSLIGRLNSQIGRIHSLFDRFNSQFGGLGNLSSAAQESQRLAGADSAAEGLGIVVVAV